MIAGMKYEDGAAHHAAEGVPELSYVYSPALIAVEVEEGENFTDRVAQLHTVSIA
jgi:hypothetical protein